MKGLILSGGHGTRLRPLTYSQQKQLIPVANKPVLFYAIEDVIEAGVDEIGIITGPNRDQVEETVEEGDWDEDVDFEFIHQGNPKGLAHTVKIAKDERFLQDDDFVMYLGDNILREGLTDHVRHFEEEGLDASIMLMEVDNPGQFGVADVDSEGRVRNLVEKPENPPSNLALVGIYFFGPPILEAVEEIDYSWRDELEITDAIQCLLDNGYEVAHTEVTGWWKDTGKPEDILHANRLVLEDLERDVRGKTENSTLEGRVELPVSAEVLNSTIRGPVKIGEGAVIEDSYVGPYTSIGPGAEIRDTELSESVIMDECEIENAGRLVDSLLGREVRLSKNDDKPEANRMVLGDKSDAELR